MQRKYFGQMINRPIHRMSPLGRLIRSWRVTPHHPAFSKALPVNSGVIPSVHCHHQCPLFLGAALI
jgi:hypothetical protein